MKPLVPIFLLFPATLLLAQEKKDEAQIVELRETISKIVDVEALRTKEAADWEARKDTMGELLEVRRRELQLLTEELEKAGASAGGFDERRNQAQADLDALREVRSLVSNAVAAAKPRLLSLTESFPQPLRREVKTETLTLESWEAGAEARDGLQAILGIISKAEQFNRRITRVNEIREGRETEVIYLGLARAYYADRNGAAGVGSPTPEGWTWEARPELSAEILSALDQLDRRRPPEVIDLPVKITSREGEQ